MIEVRKLVKRFGLKAVLRGLDFQVEPGEFVALLGPNGAGKTTFLRILASLSRPTLGEVRIAGYRLPGQAAAVRRRLGVVSHLPLLYGDLTRRGKPALLRRGCTACQRLEQRIARCWSWWGWRRAGATWCAPSRAACSSAWPSAAPCCTTRR